MCSGNELSVYTYRKLLSHLVDIEERKEEIVNGFYFEEAAQRDEFSCFLDDYLKKLEELIESIQIVENPSRERLKEINCLPYIIIGSTVELERIDVTDTYVYKIVSPYEEIGTKMDLSYLSELGRTLMLKKHGEIINVEINKALVSCRIRLIRYQ